jgi:excisionase family DNA binding protein
MSATAHARKTHRVFDTLTVAEVAEVLHCSPLTVCRACREKRIHWFRLGDNGSIKIPYFAPAQLVGPELLATVERTAATSEEVDS